jgi:hypothetical protein
MKPSLRHPLVLVTDNTGQDFKFLRPNFAQSEGDREGHRHATEAAPPPNQTVPSNDAPVKPRPAFRCRALISGPSAPCGTEPNYSHKDPGQAAGHQHVSPPGTLHKLGDRHAATSR